MEYREEPCRSALNRVKGMPFDWSLNPYTGCAHRCTFCYVRAFEARADRPSDDRYGRSIRVKVNVADVLRRELARPSWKRESVAIGAATDPYQPAEGRYRLTRACIREFGAARTPFSLITRGPMIRRDADVLADGGAQGEGARELLGADARRADLARDRARHGAAAQAPRDGADPHRRGNRHGRRARAAPARALRRSRRSSRRSSARRGRRARAGSGRTSSTCGRARGSTSSRRSPATGPSCCPNTSGSTKDGRTSRRRRPSPSGGPSASSHAPRGSRDDRRSSPSRSRSSSRSPCDLREGVPPHS